MEIIESREIIGYEQPDLYIIFRINKGVRVKMFTVPYIEDAEGLVQMFTDQSAIPGTYAYELNPKYNN